MDQPDASLPASADPLVDVCFARESGRAKRAIGDDANTRVVLMLGVGAAITLGLWLTARFLTDVVGLSRDAVYVAALSVGMLVIPGFMVWLGGLNVPRSFRALPGEADESKRVHVLCTREALERIEPIRDADFEPEYFRLVLVQPRGWGEGLVFAGMALLAFPAHWALQRVMSINMPLMFEFYAASLVGALTLGMVRQTYIRVAPGRADVLRFTAWRADADVCRTYDLRDGAVVIDPRRRRLIVQSPLEEHWGPGMDAQRLREQRTMDRMRAKAGRGRESAVVVPFVASPTPVRLAHTLLRAAVSTAPVPDLPKDRLHD